MWALEIWARTASGTIAGVTGFVVIRDCKSLPTPRPTRGNPESYGSRLTAHHASGVANRLEPQLSHTADQRDRLDGEVWSSRQRNCSSVINPGVGCCTELAKA